MSKGPKRLTMVESTRRFLTRVAPPGANGCMEWLGFRMPKGYGVWNFNQRNIYAHRFAFIASGGVLLPGQLVMHSCDNPPCVNPYHLKAGTCKDNTQDCLTKGRFTPARGEKAGLAKLNTEKVLQIRSRLSSHSNKQLAAMYGVCATAISNIRTGETWKHL